MNAKVTGATPTYIEVGGKERIPACTLVWAAGVKLNSLVKQLPCEKSKHGRIKVNACCQMEGRDGMWALGNYAGIPRDHEKGLYAPIAQNASREGKLVTRNILSTLRGERAKSFEYTPVGELALVGKHSGVARVYGHNFSGPLAWAPWRAVYLAKMLGAGQKSRVFFDWLLDFIFGTDPISISPDVPAAREEA